MLNTHLSLFTRVEDRSNQAVESSIVPPPAPPPSKTSQQGEEKGNDSSEPNSPQPDDSFSSREEQQPEEGREVFLPSGGGQLCTECAPREEREEQREGEGEVDELLDLHMRMMTSVKTDVSLCFPSFLVSSSLLPPLLPPPSFLVFLLSPPFSLLPPPSSLLPLLLSPGMMLLDHPQNFLPGGGMMPPMMPIQSKGLSSDGQPNSPPPPHGEELKKLLLQQLEYYFSKDNLSSDKYLCTSPSPSLPLFSASSLYFFFLSPSLSHSFPWILHSSFSLSFPLLPSFPPSFHLPSPCCNFSRSEIK